jgi:tetratricopeptide (TPR) repeat protein
MKKWSFAMILLSVCAVLAQAPPASQNPQTAAPQTAAKPQDSQTPAAQRPAADNPAAAQRQAEQKELQAATGEKDPAKKVKALESFIKAHPKSPMVSMAQREMVTALVKVSPGRAVKWVSKYGKKADPLERAPLFRHLAATLLKEGKNLRDAEKYAAQALKDYRWEPYAEAARKRAEAAKRPAPAEEVMHRGFDTTVADMRAVLGQAYLKQGQPAKAQAMLLEAIKLDPGLADAAQSLGEIAAKQGQSEEALKWYANAALSKPSKERKALFAETYAKVKSGTGGMEQYLDAEYRRLFPPLIHPESYQRSTGRSQRVVLAEVYTGAGCPPCVGADLAFDAVLERYNRQDVAVVMYHEHIPRPDPLSNADTVARWKFQQGRGVPTFGVDGEMSPAGGGARDAAIGIEKSVRKIIDTRLEAAPEATLELAADREGQAVKVTVQAGSKESEEISLTLLLVEKEVRYSGENGIRFHPMVVRGIASYPLKDGAAAAVHTFKQDEVVAALKKHIDDFEKFDERHNKDGAFRFSERRDEVNWANIAVVAFVQNLKTKKVLQAAWVDVSARGGKVGE